MASIYERPDRARIYARIRDPNTGKWRGVPTPYRKDSYAARRNALVWAAERDRMGAEAKRNVPHETWAKWVVPWLQQTFGYSQATLNRYLTAWAHLFEFLLEHYIATPREVRYIHASEYLTWRMAQVRPRGTPINHNTALTELKVLSRIMRESVRREFTPANPLAQLGIRRQRVKHTPAMTDEEIAKHRSALRELEGALPITQRWMTVSFEIALHQGVRLSETSVPMERVHLDPRTDPGAGVNRDRITFLGKGRNGVPRVRAQPIHPDLRPMLSELAAAGARVTCALPRLASKEWWKFRQQHGLGHLRFHSTRATLATQLAKNNVSLQKAKEIMGHHCEAVHLAYVHLTAEDVADELASVRYPAS